MPDNIFTVRGMVASHDAPMRQATITIDTETGLITNVFENKEGVQEEVNLDVGENLIFPGFGDLHVHAREDASGTQVYKEDFRTMSEAAVNGGIVHVAEMPNNPVPPIDDESYKEKHGLTRSSLVHITLYAGIGPHTMPLTIEVPYKVFMGPSVGELFFQSLEDFEERIKLYAGKSISFHCEDPGVLEAAKNGITHEAKRPSEAEVKAIATALRLIEEYGIAGKICHLSTMEGLELIKAAKARGVFVTAEVTPHHLYFSVDDLNDANRKLLQMNPPIRSKEDCEALIEGLRDGSIDFLATDHAPHTMEEKEKGTSGVPHLDTYGAFVTWLMQEKGFSPQDIARVCSYNPGTWTQTFLPQNCGKGFGVIAPGYMGSLTILDIKNPQTIVKEKIKSKCAWSPFEGQSFPGRVRGTVIRGMYYQVN